VVDESIVAGGVKGAMPSPRASWEREDEGDDTAAAGGRQGSFSWNGRYYSKELIADMNDPSKEMCWSEAVGEGFGAGR